VTMCLAFLCCVLQCVFCGHPHACRGDKAWGGTCNATTRSSTPQSLGSNGLRLSVGFTGAALNLSSSMHGARQWTLD